MEDLLNLWGFSELIGVFEENDITDIETLGELLNNNDELSSIIPKTGTRLKLRKNFTNYVQSKDNSASQVSENISEDSVIVADFLLNVSGGESVKSIDVSQETPRELIEASTSSSSSLATTVLTNEEDTLEPPLKKVKYESSISINLKEVLENNPIGWAVLVRYRHFQKLPPRSQGFLCEVILSHFYQRNTLTLDLRDLKYLAHEIHKLMPNETVKTYYVSPTKKADSRDNKSGLARGKLVDKYKNTRTFIREAENLIKKNSVTEKKAIENIEDLSEAERCRIWLIHNRSPPQQVDRNWNLSYPLRLEDCKNRGYQIVATIFEKWPILRSEHGYDLIEKDFERKYPAAITKVTDGWNQFFDKVLSLYFTNLNEREKLHASCLESDTVNRDIRTYIQLHLLSALIAPKSNKIFTGLKSNKRTFWKPSVSECREGMLVNVTDYTQIEDAAKQKCKKMQAMKLTVQPYIVTVGNEFDTINEILVRVDDFNFKVPSLLKAIELLGKIFLTFDVSYPKECEHLWYLIQWYLFDIYTKSDNQIPFIHTVVNHLKLKK